MVAVESKMDSVQEETVIFSDSPKKKKNPCDNDSSTVTSCSSVMLLSLPGNLQPVQTRGPLIQVTSVIRKVTMKDVFMI